MMTSTIKYTGSYLKTHQDTICAYTNTNYSRHDVYITCSKKRSCTAILKTNSVPKLIGVGMISFQSCKEKGNIYFHFLRFLSINGVLWYIFDGDYLPILINVNGFPR